MTARDEKAAQRAEARSRRRTAAAGSSDGDAPVWLSDTETAQAAARQSGKPLFVAFR